MPELWDGWRDGRNARETSLSAPLRYYAAATLVSPVSGCFTAAIPGGAADAFCCPWLGAICAVFLVFGARFHALGAPFGHLAISFAFPAAFGALGLAEIDCADGGDFEGFAVLFGEAHAPGQLVGSPAFRLGDGCDGQGIQLGDAEPWCAKPAPFVDSAGRVAGRVLREMMHNHFDVIAARIVVGQDFAVTGGEQAVQVANAKPDERRWWSLFATLIAPINFGKLGLLRVLHAGSERQCGDA